MVGANFPAPNGGLLVFTYIGGNPACTSYNGRDCMWGLNKNQIDLNRVQPLNCGADHRGKWGRGILGAASGAAIGAAAGGGPGAALGAAIGGATGIFGGVASTPPPPPGTYFGYPAYGSPVYGYPGYAQPGYGYPGYSGYPAYSGSPGYGYPGYSEYPGYSGPPGYGYQSRPPYSPYSGSRYGYPVAGYSGDLSSEDWSPGAEYAIKPAS
jgi:hypothetical protein